jgi:D-serine deaminase-like pyridoxal phosphate-dependent protein
VSTAAPVLAEVVVDAATKGFPAVDRPVRLEDVAGRGWTLADLQPPVLTLRASALEHNLGLMARYCRERGVELAPHGKTTMAPQLWRRQLDAGAWGITAATAVQARVMRAAGVPRVLIANELTDPPSIRWAAQTLGDDGDLLCYVDSARSVALLAEGLREAGNARPLPVLVELGHADGRTGARRPEEAVEVARAAAGSGVLHLAGIGAFEGTIARDRGDEALEAVGAFLDAFRGLGEQLLNDGLLGTGAIASAGGSRYFDVVADRLARPWPAGSHVRVLLRSGCYLTHDHGMYEAASPFGDRPEHQRFRPALEVWGSVLSRPERGLALVGLGRRDVPFDEGWPRVLRVRRTDGAIEPVVGVEITGLNDQHAFCRVPDDVPLEVGELVGCGISHPCTAFDRWRVIPVLDDDDRVVDAIATWF